MSDSVSRLNAALSGRYRVQRSLGEGGMATIYLARDERHSRNVALKVLKPEVAAAVGAERFLAEIRTTANLQHPNILPLHDSGDAGGLLFYVMPHVVGESLRDRLDRERQLPVEDAVGIAAALGEALDYAHRQGVVHRDIKPANILLVDGKPVIADFGIALALASGGAGRRTETGLSLGTPHYMSPEQATGDRATGPATDIWALGCVLYEMLVGEPPYTGSTPQAVLGRIIATEAPSAGEARKSVPSNVDAAIRKALEKMPADRFTSAARFAEALRDPGFAGTITDRRRGWIPQVAAALVIFALGAFALWTRGMSARSVGLLMPATFVVSLPEDMVGVEEPVAFGVPLPSPDGRYLAFSGAGEGAETSLWIRPLGSASARPLSGTEGATGTLAWSPDGTWIAYYAAGRLRRIRPEGGPPEDVAEIEGFQDADWGADDAILFRPNNREPLYTIPASGGLPRQVTWLNEELSENSHRGPVFLPDGRRFLFTTRSSDRANNALYLGSVDSREVVRLMPAESHAALVVPRGRRRAALLYYSGGSLVARAFDADAGSLSGESLTITTSVSYNAPSIAAGFRASRDGSVIVVSPSGSESGVFSWFGRDGEPLGILGTPGYAISPRISPAGEGFLYSSADRDSGNRDVFHIELARGFVTQLTNDDANESNAVWSPDGRRIAFSSDRLGAVERLFVKEGVDPRATELELTGAPPGALPLDWSRDGRWVLMGRRDEIWVVDMGGGGEAFEFAAGAARGGGGRFSPDGRWIVYTSDETGERQVQVRPFRGTRSTSEGRVQVSVDGGRSPVWSRSGREIFFLSPSGVLYVVDASSLGTADVLPPPDRLYQTCPNVVDLQGFASTPAIYDTADGERFLFVCYPEPGRFAVFLDWALPN